MTASLFRYLVRPAVLSSIVGLSAVVLVLGCQAAAPAPTPTRAPTPAVKTVEIDASEYAFSAPETLPAGLVTLRLVNHGHEPHHGQLLRLNDGVTFDQLTAALQQEGEGALRLVSAEGGPGTIDPHGSSEVTLDLRPGTYALACFVAGPDGVPHLARGMLKPLQVTPPSAASAPPTVQGTFTLQDFSIDMPSTLPAGISTYRVVNHGPQIHELNVVKLQPGKTAEDALAWDTAPSGPPPFESVGGMNGLTATGAGYMSLDMQPGTYLALCRVPDPASGVAHTHLGMVKQFSVS
jgi:hypothetical protein